jgi:hypothetical protein
MKSVGYMRIHSPERNGIAAVECALVAPIILLMALATLEMVSAMYLRQTATTIAFEGARLGVRGQSGADSVVDECKRLLAMRKIVNGSVTVIPKSFTNLKALDPVSVTVRVPYQGNSWFLWNLFAESDVVVSTTMAREYNN